MEDSAGSKALTTSLAKAHFQAMVERGEAEEPLVPRRKTMCCSTPQKILGLWVDMEDMTIEIPHRKLEDLRQRLANSPRSPVTGRGAAPRSVRRLARAVLRIQVLRLANLHLTGGRGG